MLGIFVFGHKRRSAAKMGRNHCIEKLVLTERLDGYLYAVLISSSRSFDIKGDACEPQLLA